MDNIIRDNKQGIQKYAKAYFDNYGESSKFENDFSYKNLLAQPRTGKKIVL